VSGQLFMLFVLQNRKTTVVEGVNVGYTTVKNKKNTFLKHVD